MGYGMSGVVGVRLLLRSPHQMTWLLRIGLCSHHTSTACHDRIWKLQAINPFRDPLRGRYSSTVHAMQKTVVRWDTHARHSGLRARSREAHPRAHQR